MNATAAVPATEILEIEIDGPRNEYCVFRPLQRRIRGRFDLRRVAEPKAMMLHTKIPDPIPGQRLRLNIAAKRAELIEPLRLPEFAAVRERYEFDDQTRKVKEFPKDEVFESVDVPTWLFFMAAEVKAGKAKVIAGKLPEKIDGKVKRSFYTSPAESREDALTSALKANTEVMTGLGELIKRLIGGGK